MGIGGKRHKITKYLLWCKILLCVTNQSYSGFRCNRARVRTPRLAILFSSPTISLNWTVSKSFVPLGDSYIALQLILLSGLMRGAFHRRSLRALARGGREGVEGQRSWEKLSKVRPANWGSASTDTSAGRRPKTAWKEFTFEDHLKRPHPPFTECREKNPSTSRLVFTSCEKKFWSCLFFYVFIFLIF